MVAAMLSLMHVEPARLGLWRATHGHSHGRQPSSVWRSSWRSYQREQPGQGPCVGGLGDGHVHLSLPMLSYRSIARGVICPTGGRVSGVRRVPLMACLASSRRRSAAFRDKA